jgi:hypothetical protein
MQCCTQEEIAEAVGMTQQAVALVLQETATLPELVKPHAFHQVDFTPPLYNIWKQQDKTPGPSHYGNSEVRWLDNLLSLSACPTDAGSYEQPIRFVLHRYRRWRGGTP